MAFKYIITIPASRDLINITEYISQKLQNPNASVEFIKDFMKTLKIICEFPRVCPIYKNRYIGNTPVRFKSIRNYLMFYRIDVKKKLIIVDHVVYAGRNLENSFYNLSDSVKK